jgi:hypothetical protein
MSRDVLKRFLQFLLICFSLLSTSCQVTFKAPPLKQSYSSYYNESFSEAPSLFVHGVAEICNLEKRSDERVYITNGQALVRCISKEGQSLVYLWKPNCYSSKCVSPEIIQAYCDKYNVSLYVVAQYYDVKAMLKPIAVEKPIFGLDTKYYKSNIQEQYLKRFYRDITKEKRKKESGNFIYFQNGNFKESFKYLDEVIQYLSVL